MNPRRSPGLQPSVIGHTHKTRMSGLSCIGHTMRVQLAGLLSIPALCVCAVVLADAQSAAQEEQEQVHRTFFDHHDQSDVPGKEIVTGTAELRAGGIVGWHVHPGDEVGYVLSGNLVLKTRGQPDRELRAGDHFFNPRGAVHSLMAAPGSNGGTAYSTWIVDKGKPLAQPLQPTG